MIGFRIRPAGAADAPRLARFVARVNADPPRRCPQSDLGEDLEAAGRALAADLARPDLVLPPRRA